MTSKLSTPGVYIVEENAFPNSVVEVATAIPVFIGYTQKAEYGGQSLVQKPMRITSFAEYVAYFGGSFKSKFDIVRQPTAEGSETEDMMHIRTSIENRIAKNPDSYIKTGNEKWYILLKEKSTAYLYNSIRLFFANGGGPCHILSVGTYGDSSELEIKVDEIINEIVLDLLEETGEPTLVVAPDLIAKGEEAYLPYQQILAHCDKVRSRLAILDIAHPFPAEASASEDAAIRNFREKIGVKGLDFGAAYYQWLKTSVVLAKEVTEANLDLSLNQLIEILPEQKAKELLIRFLSEQASGPQPVQLNEEISMALKAQSPTYATILEIMRETLNLLPPSAAMAGIYTQVDNNRGVWKAPANVSLNMVISPSINITHVDQEFLNVPIDGKSINAIRTFIGEGTLVWGARTLDGNSLDWRYINVKRTAIMIEQSIKQALKAYTFSPNNSATWITVKSMVNNFLISIWKSGGLVGAKPQDAFDIQVGLGATMTATDLLDNRMIVQIKIAIVRPAEFILITFCQQMQQS